MIWFSKQNFSQADKTEWMKWFFGQQKFAPLSPVDTITYKPNVTHMKGAQGGYVDAEGYATSISKHPIANFKLDSRVKEIIPCKSIDYLDQKLPIGIYEDGKVMIQQQANRSCVAACGAMLALDHGKKFDISKLSTVNLANNDYLIDFLKASGLVGKCHKVTTPGITEYQAYLKKYGPLSCGVSDPQMRSHKIILDKIDDQNAIIRDPFYGYRIRMSTAEFLKMNPDSFVYVEKK